LWYPFVYLLDINPIECFLEFGIDRALSSSLGIAYAILIILPLIGTSARASVARVLSICALGYVAIYAVWSVVNLFLEPPELWEGPQDTAVVHEPADDPAPYPLLEQGAELDQPPHQNTEPVELEELVVSSRSEIWRSNYDLAEAGATVILCTLPLATGALIFGLAAGLAMGRFLKLRECTTLIAISFASGLFGGVLNLIWQGGFLSPLRGIDIALVFSAWLLMLAWTFERSLRSEASS
jgi:hypothetical protein